MKLYKQSLKKIIRMVGNLAYNRSLKQIHIRYIARLWIFKTHVLLYNLFSPKQIKTQHYLNLQTWSA